MNILIRFAEESDAIATHKLMEEVYNRLEDKSLYIWDNLDYVKEQIKGNGFAIVSCNEEGKIIGSFIFRYPYQSADNLGRDINLPKGYLSEVVHMESSVVLPEYRGNDLQLKMLQYAEKLIDTSKYHYFMATVSPNNPASYKSFEKAGYKHISTKEKYDGLLRRIYLKEV